MNNVFSKERKLIQQVLISFLDKEQKVFIEHTWSKDVFQRLRTFLLQGKMVRGSLVLLSFSLFESDGVEKVLSLACASELFHAGLLIHDDIMDQDHLRRGNPSLFIQYQQICTKKDAEASLHFGKSMATCVGDIAFFLGYALVNAVNVVPSQKTRIIELYSQEYIAVGFAQMQDIFHGIAASSITEEAIIQLYKYKTGRYTFSLPCMVGAIAANQEHSLIEKLERIGEDLGILFQLKDDEIGLFGTEEQIGKPVWSDIRENKKTLYWYYLFTHAQGSDKERLQRIFGNPQSVASDRAFVHACIKKYSVLEMIAEKRESLQRTIECNIEDTPLPKEKKQLFFDLLVYSLERKK